VDPPVKVGERLVVYGRPERAIVKGVVWHPLDHRWVIVLDWGMHGTSRVYGDDEDKVWYRPALTN
jgi:hypothetical protein